MQGLEISEEDVADDALGMMQHRDEHNASAYCEAEEVLAKLPLAESLPSPLSGFRTCTDSSQNPNDWKENVKGFTDGVDGGASAFVNWLLVSPPLLVSYIEVYFVSSWGTIKIKKVKSNWPLVGEGRDSEAWEFGERTQNYSFD